MSEAQILASVRAYIERHPKVAKVWRNTAGTAMFHGNHYQLGEPGISDLIGFMKDGRFLAIETKDKGKKPTKAQAAFLQAVLDAGGIGGIARSIEDAAMLLAE